MAIGVVVVGPDEQATAGAAEAADMVDDRTGDAARTDAREVAVRALRRSLGHPFPVGFVLGGLLSLGAAVLVIQNGESARINWLGMEFSAPLWLVLLLTLVAGALIWETTRAAVRRGRRLRRERREALQRLREDAATS